MFGSFPASCRGHRGTSPTSGPDPRTRAERDLIRDSRGPSQYCLDVNSKTREKDPTLQCGVNSKLLRDQDLLSRHHRTSPRLGGHRAHTHTLSHRAGIISSGDDCIRRPCGKQTYIYPPPLSCLLPLLPASNCGFSSVCISRHAFRDGHPQ